MHPYNIEQIGDRLYRFVTDKGVAYILSFIYIGGIDNLPIFSFNIERMSERASNGCGNRLRDTVACVIDGFLNEEENAILSTCDVDDASSESRYRLFRMWFNGLRDDSVVRKEQRVSNGDGYTWALLYYRKGNILASVIETYFDDYVEIMNSE